jgi:hypothetical protein
MLPPKKLPQVTSIPSLALVHGAEADGGSDEEPQAPISSHSEPTTNVGMLGIFMP